jgi:threonyl-tRNA synthetase
MSLASSYWHGDENSDRLTRVYATAFYRQQDLDDHLARLEEAKARDHRVLGKKLQLFHIDEAVGQGLILWTPNGSIVRKELQDFIGAELRKQGYFDVFCPHIGKLGLYKTSGHFPYYAESQYVPVLDREFIRHVADDGCSCAQLSNMLREGDVEGYLLKPMNCPHHIKIYSSQPRSYRDLPVRLSEFGTVYRWEQSGELAGMLRVRSFTVDDAHLFVREDQIGAEVRGCLSLVKLAFETIGLHDFRVRVGLRDPDSSKYVGDAANWDKAEAACRDAAATLGVRVSEEPGEAAFYGPKIDFIVRDVIGREWQLGTVQVDYNLPQRFDLTYTGSDNQPHRPVMIHRAPFGSMERFVGFLIEHFAGAFPVWLAPEQVRVLPISEKTNDYAHRVLGALKDAGVRAALDDANDRVQSKIRHAAEMKIPYMLVVGPRDEEQGTVSVRARGHQKDLGAMPIDEFVEGVAVEARRRLAWEADGTIAAAMAPAGV